MFGNEWEDCQALFSETVDNYRRYNLVEAMNMAGIDYDDNVHDGLVDAENTALHYKKLKTEKIVSFSEYYATESNRLTSSFADILCGLELRIS